MFEWQLEPRAEGDAACGAAHVGREGKEESEEESGLFPAVVADVVVVLVLLRSSRMRIAVVIGNRLIDF